MKLWSFLQLSVITILTIFILNSCDSDKNGTGPSNEPPVILSLIANPTIVDINENSIITCTANDPDGDNLTYVWEVSGGSISGTGSSVTWTAPNTQGSYSVSCTADDGNGGQDFESVNIIVTENELPVIISLIADPTSVEINETSLITCTAFDPDGDNLTYVWETSGGSIGGTGSSVTWTAPNIGGSYSVSCTVDDSNGGQDFESVDIEVTLPFYFVDDFSTNTGWTNAYPQAYLITNGELHWYVERNGITEKFYRPTELINPYSGDFRFQADFIITSTSPNCGFYSGLISSLNNGGSWFLEYAGIFIDINSGYGERRFMVLQTTETASCYESDAIIINENTYYHADLQVVGQNYQLTVTEGGNVVDIVQGIFPYQVPTYNYIGFGGPCDDQGSNISGKTDNLAVSDQTTWDGQMD